ncbi:MAG TPA: hypothetical protein VI197_03240, partial [Polyangiaceae bacterium]
MAHKRARKPLKVREPLVRYVLRDAVRVASTSVAASGAGDPASGAGDQRVARGTQRAARGPSEWRDDWTAGEREGRQALRGWERGAPWVSAAGAEDSLPQCIASSASPRVL